MTLSEILDMIDLLYNNNFSDNEKTIILNQQLRMIFRDLQNEEFYEFTTIADQCFYAMASDMSIDFIEYVGLTTDTTVTSNSSFTEYSFAEMSDVLSGYKYFDGLSGNIGLYPVPSTTGYNVRIRYKERPVLLDSTNQSVTPNIKEDYHMALVYATISEIASAGSNPDIDIANNYTNKFNAILRELKQNRYELLPKYSATKNVMKSSRNKLASTDKIEVIVNV